MARAGDGLHAAMRWRADPRTAARPAAAPAAARWRQLPDHRGRPTRRPARARCRSRRGVGQHGPAQDAARLPPHWRARGPRAPRRGRRRRLVRTAGRRVRADRRGRRRLPAPPRVARAHPRRRRAAARRSGCAARRERAQCRFAGAPRAALPQGRKQPSSRSNAVADRLRSTDPPLSSSTTRIELRAVVATAKKLRPPSSA